jgi:hypothetical protein
MRLDPPAQASLRPRRRFAGGASLIAALVGTGACSVPRTSPEAMEAGRPSSPENAALQTLSDAAIRASDATSAADPSVAEPGSPPWESAVAPPPSPGASGSSVKLAPGIEVDRAQGEVRVEGQCALDEGWLEQAVCTAGTREHESLVVIESPPRLVHAALLMLGLEAGRPGAWLLEADGETIRREPPVGPMLEVHVRFETPDGAETTVPLSRWVETPRGGSIPEHPWRFAGSRFESARDGGELYAADFSGSVVGLVTFGDEVVAFEEVRSDQVAIEEAGFLVRRGQPPPPGTRVTLIFRTPRAR